MKSKNSSSFKDYQDSEFRHRPAVQIGITTVNLDHSLEFYVNSLGCRLKLQSDNLLVLDFFGVELNLIRPDYKEKLSYSKEPINFLGLSMHWDDWHRAIDHLNYIGIKYHEKPTLGSGPENKFFASFSMKDPSGNILKFSAFRS